MDFPRTLGRPAPRVARARLRPGRVAVGRSAAAMGEFDVAALALVRAANEHRKAGQPTFEVFALVELAAVYHHQKRFDRLPALARRVRGVLARSSLSVAQVAIVQLAAELIESDPDDPAGLDLFGACWQGRGAVPPEGGS